MNSPSYNRLLAISNNRQVSISIALWKYLFYMLIFISIASGCVNLGSLQEHKVQITRSKEKLSKVEFFNDNYIVAVSDITMGELDPIAGPEIGIAGKGGIFFIDTKGKLKKKVELKYNFGFSDWAEIAFTDTNKDNIAEYMIKGPMLLKGALLDHDGNVKWIYDVDYTEDMDTGDVNGDGKPEFAIACSYGHGIHLADINGKKIWGDDSVTVRNVGMLDTNGDGNDEIIYSDIMGNITILDKNGTVIKTFKSQDLLYGPFNSTFTLIRWPNKNSALKLMTFEEDCFNIYDISGNKLITLPTEKHDDMNQTIKATTVKFNNNQPEYIAALLYGLYPLDVFLYVFDSEGKLVHEEKVLDTKPSIRYRSHEGGALAALPLHNDGSDVLLVGNHGTVWQYELQGDKENVGTATSSLEKRAGTDVVKFPDKALEAAIRRALGKPDGEITAGELASLTELKVDRLSTPTVTEYSGQKNVAVPITKIADAHLKIKNLEGIQYCTNLFSLKIDRNEITDITPISNLKSLASVDFTDNLIEDISPISGLNNLKVAKFRQNRIKSSGKLENLYNLRLLDLGDNRMQDITSISNLNKLEVLLLDQNEVSDIRPLENLPLKDLNITRNRIKDISPLGNISSLFLLRASENIIETTGSMQKMSNLKYLELKQNKIKDIANIAELPALREVDLAGNLVSDIKAIKNLKLSEVDRFEYSIDSYEKELEGYPLGQYHAMMIVTKTIILFDNQIVDIEPILKMKGLDDKLQFGIGGNPLNEKSMNTIIPELKKLGVQVYMEKDKEITG